MTTPNRPDLDAMRADLAHAQACGAVDCPAECEVIVDDHAPTLLAYAERLEAEVERLRGLVEIEAKNAWVEAWQKGAVAEWAHSIVDADELLECMNDEWPRSRTHAALNEQEKTDD
jgi:hypothetical protein